MNRQQPADSSHHASGALNNDGLHWAQTGRRGWHLVCITTVVALAIARRPVGVLGQLARGGEIRPGFRGRLWSRGAAIRLASLFGIMLITVLGAGDYFFVMPGFSYHGPLEPLAAKQTELSEELRRDDEVLARDIGPRNTIDYKHLQQAADFVEAGLVKVGGYRVTRQSYAIGNKVCDNIEAELPGGAQADEIVVIGAHYDSVYGCPAANDNGSGVAALLALARRFAGSRPARTLRFVAFVNEEPPFFQSENMGSLVYARRCKERGEKVVAMLSLETLGCYSDQPGSQQYPFPLNAIYPSTGNFIGFIGDTRSRGLVRESVGAFRRSVKFPSEGGAAPASIAGVGYSDQWSFWQVGYPAVMVTDTAMYRYRDYHTPGDTPEKLDFGRMARVVDGLRGVVAILARAED